MALEGDKRILVIALLTSLTVSLAVNLLYVYGGQLFGSCGGTCSVGIPEEREISRGPVAVPPGKPSVAPGKSAVASVPAPGIQNRRRGGEGGVFGMRIPATPELLALYKERAELYGKYAVLVTVAFNASGKDSLDVTKACLARDKAKLAYWRRKADLRPAPGAAEAFLQYKVAEKVQKYTEGMFEAGTIDQDKRNLAVSDLIDAQIQLQEALLRVRDKTEWDKAAKALENYPKNVTDELLRNLLEAAEQPRGPR